VVKGGRLRTCWRRPARVRTPSPAPRGTPESSASLIDFGLWLLKKGNTESMVKRKLRYLKGLHGSPEEMILQVLSKDWADKSKKCALDVICQFAEFIGKPIQKPEFRVYNNREMYVPDPEMVKQFLYRIRSPKVRAVVLTAIETGASASEVSGLTWRDVNFEKKTLTIRRVKGHKTYTYRVSDGLSTLLLQLPKEGEKIFNYKDPKHINDAIRDYRKRLTRETGNPDFLKIHFHTFRHFAISWFYFKTKDPVATQRFARHHSFHNTRCFRQWFTTWLLRNGMPREYVKEIRGDKRREAIDIDHHIDKE